MYRLTVATLLFVITLPASSAEQLRVTFGSEYFAWREYTNGSRLLKETGQRYFIGLRADSDLHNSWNYNLASRIYLGRVDYDGSTMADELHTTDTDYLGWSAELGMMRSFPLAATEHESALGFRFGIGYDRWQRKLLDKQNPYLGREVYGYTEDYQVGYGRLGAVYSLGGDWELQGGVKIPFYTSEDVGLGRVGYDSDVSLRPKPDYSLYASINYRLSGRWDLGGYYDSYRFRQSDSVSVTSSGTLYKVYQPKSQQDSIGLFLNYRF